MMKRLGTIPVGLTEHLFSALPHQDRLSKGRNNQRSDNQDVCGLQVAHRHDGPYSCTIFSRPSRTILVAFCASTSRGL